MAAQSYYRGDKLEDDTSDIGKLWEQALLNYEQKCGVDLSTSGREKWKMTTIEAEETMAAIVQDKRQIYVLFSLGHIFNWFNTGELRFNATTSFKLAHKALRQCKDLLPENTELQAYFEDFTADEAWGFDPPEKSFMVLANTFPDIQKTPKAYRSIDTVMSACDYIKPGIDLFRSCVAKTTDKEDLFQLHSALGRILFQTDEDERLSYDPSKSKRNPYEGEEEAAKTARICEALEHLNNAIAAKPTLFDKTSDDDWELLSMMPDDHQRRVRAHLELGGMSSLLRGVGAYTDEMKAYADHKYFGTDLSAIIPALAKRGQWADMMRLMRMISAKDRARSFDLGCWTYHWGRADLFDEVDEEMVTKASWGQALFLVRWADFHSTALRTAEGSTKTAEALLARVLDGPKDERFTDAISGASQHLADIVLREFHEAKDAKGKTASFDDMKILHPASSHDAAEAQVAATCQLYIVDMDIWKKEQEDGGKSAEAKAKRAAESEERKKVDEGLDPTISLECSGCGNEYLELA
ncbi:hypothetical protein B0H67DRAFT_681171 [Lasiosphaeris hirsuta]|uniref:Uncharacterized protein n=1 Tax=Lasiosphaeris hirsuta TaxID=260670 RepID=A0AA40E840_9PEZI|nr:hypothetical protein B0H67DRAFT_681171 [Lasiosphaeris hirsuta]